uniref:Uncharacterized protein n=1 Tax=Ditylenchus dipsaci TaxID=166011 RepID=A0A915DG24_9BILA
MHVPLLQAVLHYIKDLGKGMINRYKEDEVFRSLIRAVLALPLLPPDLVELIWECFEDASSLTSDSVAVKPLHLWIFIARHKNKNAAEAYIPSSRGVTELSPAGQLSSLRFSTKASISTGSRVVRIEGGASGKRRIGSMKRSMIAVGICNEDEEIAICASVDYGDFYRCKISDLRVAPKLSQVITRRFAFLKHFSSIPGYRCCLDISKKPFGGFPSSTAGLQSALCGESPIDDTRLKTRFLSYDNEYDAFTVDVFRRMGPSANYFHGENNYLSVDEICSDGHIGRESSI